MINLKNSLILAGTKLKTRKIRMIVTVIISSLLFGVLSVGIITFTGFTNSVGRFSNEGLNNRFFVQLAPAGGGSDLYRYFETDEARQRATEVANQLAEQRVKRGKEIGLEVSKKDELNYLLPVDLSKAVDGQKLSVPMDDSSPVSQTLAAEFQKKNPPSSKEMILNQANVDRITTGYDVVGSFQPAIYVIDGGGALYPADTKGGYPLNPETPATENKPEAGFEMQEAMVQIQSLPDSMANAYRFDNFAPNPDSKSIPIMVSLDKAEKLLKLQKLSPSSSNQDSLVRQREVREKITGFKFKQCYRNSLANSQLTEAAAHAQNQKDKDYTKPELIYGLPANNACQVAPVIADTRSAETKKHQAALDQFEIEFRDRDPKPIAKEIEFEVVGLLPPAIVDYNNFSLASQLIQTAIGSPFMEVAAADNELQAALKNQNLESVLVDQASVSSLEPMSSWMLEFADLKQAQDFIKQRDCNSHYFSQIGPFGDFSEIKCDPEHPFSAFPAINNRIGLKDIIESLFKVGLVVLIVISVIATIIMMGTVGRMITDSRRETAVFRAIGFKRLDISFVYGLYTLIVCLFIIGVSFAIGVIGASIIAARLDHDLTVQAILATNAKDQNLKMSMVGFSPLYLGALVLAILVVGLLSISLPLIRNLRRNPIKDMRDE